MIRWLAPALVLVAAALLARRAKAAAPPRADSQSQTATLLDEAIVTLDPSTYTPPAVDDSIARRNEQAFLHTIKIAEGTARAPDPYRVTFGYGHTIRDLSDHPYFTGEWRGRAFTYRGADGEQVQSFTTAAGAYQFLRRTWSDLKTRLYLADFGPASQDLAALELIRQRGALGDVQAGRFATAIEKVRPVWASLPGAGYGQPERSFQELAAAFAAAGGTITA